MTNNRIRHLDRLLGIDVWHQKTGISSRIADLFMRLSFHEGRLGGGQQDDVKFQVRLHSVEVTAITSNFKVKRDSIYEQSKVKIAESTTKHKVENSSNAGGEFNFGVSAKELFGKIGVNLGISRKKTNNNEVDISEKYHQIQVLTSSDEKGNPVWILKPGQISEKNEITGKAYLQGTPWASNEQTLFKMKDMRKDQSKEEEPDVQVVLTCRREDLEIFDIEYRDESGKWNKADSNDQQKYKLATEHIKNQILKRHLSIEDSDSSYEKWTLCDVYSEPIIEDEWNNER